MRRFDSANRPRVRPRRFRETLEPRSQGPVSVPPDFRRRDRSSSPPEGLASFARRSVQSPSGDPAWKRAASPSDRARRSNGRDGPIARKNYVISSKRRHLLCRVFGVDCPNGQLRSSDRRDAGSSELREAGYRSSIVRPYDRMVMVGVRGTGERCDRRLR